MSNKQNDQWLESKREDFLTSGDEQVLEVLRYHGFKKEAEELELEEKEV